MSESDYFESGLIVQRLERWRLQTSHGLEVGLMGMINVSKSVANGFPEAVRFLTYHEVVFVLSRLCYGIFRP